VAFHQALVQFGEVAFFQDPAVSQPRALRQLLDAVGLSNVSVVDDYCSSKAWAALTDATVDFTDGRWVTACDGDGYVLKLILVITYDTQQDYDITKQMVDGLLMLDRLEVLELRVDRGTLPLQLGALPQLQELRS